MTRILLTLLIIGAITQPSSKVFASDTERTIEIHAHRYSFEPSQITLKKGETVTLRLTSDDVTHSLLVRGLQINQEVTKGHPVEIKVTPASAGDFPGQCGHFCGGGHGSMKFSVHVTE